MTKLAGRAIVAASAGAHSTRRGCATLSPIERNLRDNDPWNKPVEWIRRRGIQHCIDSRRGEIMRRFIPAWIVLAFALLLPSIAAAQNVRGPGQVLDRDGKPWAGLTVVI